jgi:hypothetical protein
MIPKKASKLYSQVAEDLNVEETLVEDFIEYLYKELRFHLSELIYPRVNMDGLGHFVIKPKWVESSIKKHQNQLENYDASTFNAYSRKVRIENNLGLLIEVQKKYLVERERRTNFRQEKNEKHTKINLAEPETDN